WIVRHLRVLNADVTKVFSAGALSRRRTYRSATEQCKHKKKTELGHHVVTSTRPWIVRRRFWVCLLPIGIMELRNQTSDVAIHRGPAPIPNRVVVVVVSEVDRRLA